MKRRLLSLGVHADGMPGKLTILLHVDASIRGAALQELEQWWKLISLARFLELPICPDESVDCLLFGEPDEEFNEFVTAV